jgi:uncharacterized protein YutE (UPF0331/DUF86 family)
MTPVGRLDATLVRRHLAALDGAVANLQHHVGRPISELKASVDETWAVERGLQICAQNALDIATHLVASAGLDVPDYATAIDRLIEMSVLPAPFGTRFRAVAGFRNVLVHAYLDVDPARVHEILNQRLTDFIEFSRHVDSFLVSRPEK